MNRKSVRGLLLGMSIAMLLQIVGCGSRADIPVESKSVLGDREAMVSSSDEAMEGVEAGDKSKTEDTNQSKKKIEDFYLYVNGEWMETAKVNEEKPYYSFNEEIMDREQEILQEWYRQNPADFDDAPGMQNVIKLIQLCRDTSQQEEKYRDSLLADMQRIDDVKNLDELYELYGDEFFYAFNYIWRYTQEKYDSDTHYVQVAPTNRFQSVNADNAEILQKSIKEYIINRGVNEEKAEKMAEDFVTLEVKIAEHSAECAEEYFYRMDKTDMEKEGLTLPIQETYDRLRLLEWKKEIYLKKSDITFWNELCREKNLPILKNHMEVCFLLDMGGMLGLDSLREVFHIYDELVGQSDYVYSESELLESRITIANAWGTLGDYYTKKIIGEEILEEAKEITEDIIVNVRQMIRKTPWLSTHGKEQAEQKLTYMKFFYGTNSYAERYDSLSFGEDLYDVQKQQLHKSYEISQSETDDNTVYQNVRDNPLVNNAFYHMDQNATTIGTVFLEWLRENPQASYEEKLGVLGVVTAHEISHAYDVYGSGFDKYGAYNPWMKEEEYEKYSECAEKVKKFFDGKKTADGFTIDGEMVLQETFADLMGMECCLSMLRQRENADYDAFFTAYAKSKAWVNTPEYAKTLIESDGHLPSHDRVNFVLAQFDEFYDTYEVLPDSPYYVANEDRCQNLWTTESAAEK